MLISHRYFKTDGTLMIPHTHYRDMQCVLMFESLAEGDHSIGRNHVVHGNKWTGWTVPLKTRWCHCLKSCLVAFRLLSQPKIFLSRLEKFVAVYLSDLSFAQPTLFFFKPSDIKFSPKDAVRLESSVHLKI